MSAQAAANSVARFKSHAGMRSTIETSQPWLACYVSEVNTVINYDTVAKVAVKDGNGGLRVPLYCNEYCGLGHHFMWSRLVVTPKQG